MSVNYLVGWSKPARDALRAVYETTAKMEYGIKAATTKPMRDLVLTLVSNYVPYLATALGEGDLRFVINGSMRDMASGLPLRLPTHHPTSQLLVALEYATHVHYCPSAYQRLLDDNTNALFATTTTQLTKVVEAQSFYEPNAKSRSVSLLRPLREEQLDSVATTFGINGRLL